MTSERLNPLERSFQEIAASNNFTTFGITYRGEGFGPNYRFSANAHFNDAAEGKIPCASGDGATTAEAITSLMREVVAKRTTVASPALYGDDELVADAA